MNNRRLLWASVTGVVVTVLPILVQMLTESDPLRLGAGLLMGPGALVSILLAGGFGGGGVHNLVWQIAVLVNFIFYSGIAYVLLTLRARYRRKTQDGSAATHSQGSA